MSELLTGMSGSLHRDTKPQGYPTRQEAAAAQEARLATTTTPSLEEAYRVQSILNRDKSGAAVDVCEIEVINPNPNPAPNPTPTPTLILTLVPTLTLILTLTYPDSGPDSGPNYDPGPGLGPKGY